MQNIQLRWVIELEGNSAGKELQQNLSAPQDPALKGELLGAMSKNGPKGGN